MQSRRQTYQLLSELLEYPGEGFPAVARQCRDLLQEVAPGAAGWVAEVVAYAENSSAGRWEEMYTATFDLNPQCCPYTAYQLLGENPKRADLMLKLREIYRARGFDEGNELPDHVAVLLRFLAQTEDERQERELAEDLLAPALQKMTESVDEKNVYGAVLRAALSVASRVSQGEATP